MNAAHVARAGAGLVAAGLAVAGILYATGSLTSRATPEPEVGILRAIPTTERPVNTDRDGRDPFTEPLGSKATQVELPEPYDWERDRTYLPDATATPKIPEFGAAEVIEPEDPTVDYRSRLYADRGTAPGSANPPKPIGIDGELLTQCLAAAPGADSPEGEGFMLACVGTTITTGA